MIAGSATVVGRESLGTGLVEYRKVPGTTPRFGGEPA
jgi:hypothetical protein